MTNKMIQTVIIMGPPGAGKGVQSELLAKTWSAIHLSSGALLRQTADPRLITIMGTGLAVPPEDFEAVMRRAVLALPIDRSIVFDGVTIRPVEVPWMLSLLQECGRRLDRVILLRVDENVANERVSKRDRYDDAKQVERWHRYRAETLQSIELYRRLGLLTEVDGTGTIAAVAARIKDALSSD